MRIMKCDPNNVFKHYHYSGDNENYIYLIAHQLYNSMPEKPFKTIVPSSGKSRTGKCWQVEVVVNDIIADIGNSDLELNINIKCNGFIYRNMKAEVWLLDDTTVELAYTDEFDITLLDKHWNGVSPILIEWVEAAQKAAQSNLRLLHDHQQALAEED